MGLPSVPIENTPLAHQPTFPPHPSCSLSSQPVSPLTSTPINPSRSLLPDFLSFDPSSSSNLLSPLATPLLDISPSPLPDHMSCSPNSKQGHRNGLSLSDISFTRTKELTPRKLKIFKYAKVKERKIKRLQNIVQKLRAEKHQKKWEGISRVKDLLYSLLHESAAVLLTAQLKVAGKKPKGRRWTEDEKLLSLLLYKRSPKTYCLLRYLFTLPSRTTITSILHSIPFSPGINPQIFASLSHSLGQMEDSARTCVLMFDEMSIMEHCEYNSSLDLITGYEDHGQNRRSKTPARYSLVFMVCGVLKKWKQPIAFYFSGSQTKSEVIVSRMEEVLQQCHEAGLRVIAIVSDMGANNVTAIRSMGSSITHPYITHQNHTIFTLFDPPHLIKATRNLLLNHNFLIPVEYGTNSFTGTASWAHIEEAYNHAKGAILHRPLNRITDDHICPQGAKKMKVKLAAQVMSKSLAVYLEEGCRSGWLNVGALATSAFIGNVDSLFDSMNGRGQDSFKPLLKEVMEGSPHFQFWERAAALVSEWKIIKEMKSDGGVKFLLMPPSQQGWLHNLQAFPQLCKSLLSGPGAVTSSISARSFNQDPLENLFSCLRGNCGSNTRPTTTQFTSSLKTFIVNGLAFSSNVSGQNCEANDNKLLDSLRSWLNLESVTTDIGESTDSDGCSGFVVSENVEGAAVASEGLISFLCSYVLRTIVKQCCCCSCRDGLLDGTENPTAAMYFQGWDGDRLNPRKDLLEAVIAALQITERVLNDTPHREGISAFIKAIVEMEVSFEWLSSYCEDHWKEMASKIAKAVIRQTILWWCRKVNKR